MKYCLIININSGSGNSEKKFSKIKKYLKSNDQLKIYETTSIKQMEKILEKEKNIADTLVFAGGDGTFRSALSYCYYNQIKLPIGLIPAGSGNDLVRSLNVPKNLEKNFANIISGQTTKLYPVEINNSVYFNIASVGLDAEIVAKQRKYKKFFTGSFSYMISTIDNLITFNPYDLELYIDGEKTNSKYSLIAMASGIYYGGGMKIAPNAKLNSEFINVVCLRENNKIKWPYYLSKMLQGKHLELDGVDEFNCKSLIVKAKREIKINLDGDIIKGNYIKVKKLTNYELNILSSPKLIE